MYTTINYVELDAVNAYIYTHSDAVDLLRMQLTRIVGLGGLLGEYHKNIRGFTETARQ